MKKDFTQKKQDGYTIIETMIAVSLFVTIVTLGMGALLNANLIHNKGQNTRSIMDSLSFAMEDLSRNLKTGSTYHCLLTGQTTIPIPATAKSCAGGGYGIAFEHELGSPATNDDQWVYAVSNTVNSDGTTTAKLFKSTTGLEVGKATWVQLTPDEVILDPLSSLITVVGAEPPSTGDAREPFVIIRLKGTINYKGVVTPFSLETAASQRAIDI
jgi:hypothetical protein